MKTFEEYKSEIHRKRLSAAILLMGVPLYLSFSVLDWFFAPSEFYIFFSIRLISCCILLAIAFFFSNKKEKANRYIVQIGHIGTFVLGLGIGYMSYVTGGLDSPYYAGLNWIAIGSLAFWPCVPKDRIISMMTIYGPLLILVAINGKFELTVVSFVSLIFMAGTCGLSILNNSLSMTAFREEFSLRSKLQDLIEDKDKIIEKKSNEAANLKRLAKQFSPAVIEAIESKSISLNQRNRREIAVIFIDIADSTLRSNSIDHGDYQKALDIFFDLAIKKLLEKNITVANFMGDGLMAIANAPYSMKDYESLALQTCIEILTDMKKIKKHLKELWRAEFKVRIGISSGYVSVGFFPNNDFGIYTAIGESVNLASRLCSVAPSNAIALTKKVALSSESILPNVKLKFGGAVKDLKGFSTHDLEYFIVDMPESPVDEIVATCPLCSSITQEVDLVDCILIKCTSCKYSDIQSKDLIDRQNKSKAS